jgi:hypothetical protein
LTNCDVEIEVVDVAAPAVAGKMTLSENAGTAPTANAAHK